ncbi:MAG TPA: hypothetical protein VFN79_11270 [Steroidobacteraceae bacterium]|nr:hypothetical protein [Steroidobacteraceae bacterium]
MSDPGERKIRRLGELPREVAPPHDGWPALEARLRASGMRAADNPPERPGAGRRVSRWQRQLMRLGALAAVLAAVVLGISIDRWVLSPGHPAPQRMAAPGTGAAGAGLQVAYITDPRYLREREALLSSLNARLASLPPPTRQKVLQSLSAIHQSMREIQLALGREPGNALLQELLIDTYQNEMHVLSTVQEASYGSGET